MPASSKREEMFMVNPVPVQSIITLPGHCTEAFTVLGNIQLLWYCPGSHTRRTIMDTAGYEGSHMPLKA